MTYDTNVLLIITRNLQAISLIFFIEYLNSIVDRVISLISKNKFLFKKFFSSYRRSDNSKTQQKGKMQLQNINSL